MRYTGPMTKDAGVPRNLAISVVVLAGGQSRRLGKDKSLLEVEGQSLLARAVRTVAALSDDIVIVTNEPARYRSLALPARFVPDEMPGVGSLMGIYSGVKAVRHTHALTVACDMPFLCLPLLRHMVTMSEGYDVVIPRLNGMLEPLHAIYGRSCLPFMVQLLDRGQHQIIAFFDKVRVRYVAEGEVDRYDPRRLSFVNVNTPEDWKRVEELLSQPDPG